jgi:hypothetical protein
MVFWYMAGRLVILPLVSIGFLSWLFKRLIDMACKKKKWKPHKAVAWCFAILAAVPVSVWIFYPRVPEELEGYEQKLRSATQADIGFVNSRKFDYVVPVRGDNPSADKIAYPCAESRYLYCDWQGKRISGEVKGGYYFPGTATFYTCKDGFEVRQRRYEVGRLVEEYDTVPASEDGLHGRRENIKVYCKDGRILTPTVQKWRHGMCGEE